MFLFVYSFDACCVCREFGGLCFCVYVCVRVCVGIGTCSYVCVCMCVDDSGAVATIHNLYKLLE